MEKMVREQKKFKNKDFSYCDERVLSPVIKYADPDSISLPWNCIYVWLVKTELKEN